MESHHAAPLRSRCWAKDSRPVQPPMPDKAGDPETLLVSGCDEVHDASPSHQRGQKHASHAVAELEQALEQAQCRMT